VQNNFSFGAVGIDMIRPGMQASYSHTVTDADIKAYAGLSGDNNPMHMSDEYAARSIFGQRCAHGMFSVGFFSALFGTKIPGPGCLYVGQSLRFKKPVFINDTVLAKVIVERVDLEKRRVFFKTVCTVAGITVIDGEAEIYIPKSS